MKYNCDVVSDLMPLCIDDAASEASKKIVWQHMSECERCMNQYEMLSKEIEIDDIKEEPMDQYTKLAKRLRRQKRVRRFLCIMFAALFMGLCMNYAAGYRFSSQKSADISGQLNYKSRIIGSYHWKNCVFYFYDSDSCYDVVITQNSWHGWKAIHTSLAWPKWYLDPEDRIGMEMAGAVWFVSNDHGIQAFPFISWDEKVKRVEATAFGLTKSTEVETGEFTLLTFDDAKATKAGNSDMTAKAYDADGNILYTLAEERGYWYWKKA